MPQAPRPDKKCMQIAYKILNIPKEKQQDNQREVSAEKRKEWFRDSSMCQ
jgi:hypothetical protein